MWSVRYANHGTFDLAYQIAPALMILLILMRFDFYEGFLTVLYLYGLFFIEWYCHLI